MAVEFEKEFADLARPVQTELLANACLIERFGPRLGRPRVDTLKGSRYTNRYAAHVARVDTHAMRH
jgi:hypothetical protein